MKQKPGLSRIALLNNREDSSRLALAAQVESECWQPCGAAPHSTGETDELSVITSDDCTVSIVPSIINFLLQDSHKAAEYFSWFVCQHGYQTGSGCIIREYFKRNAQWHETIGLMRKSISGKRIFYFLAPWKFFC